MSAGISKQLPLFIRLAAFFCLFLSSCSSPEERLQSKIDEQMFVIAHTLSKVHSLSDLQGKEILLKESFLHLSHLLIQMPSNRLPVFEPSSSLAAEELLKELKRLYKIEKMRFEMEKIQQPALEVFVSYFEKK